MRPGTSSLNRSHALDDWLEGPWGSGRGGLELGTRTVPEDARGGGKYRDVAVASLDCRGGTSAILSLLDDQDGGDGAAELLREAFCCFWVFLNLSCSKAAFCEDAGQGE